MCNAYRILVLEHKGKWPSGQGIRWKGKIHNLNSSLLIIKVIKSRCVRKAGQVAYVWWNVQCIHNFCLKTQREVTILASRWEGKIMDPKAVWYKTVNSIYFAEDWYGLMKMVMDLWIPLMVCNLVTVVLGRGIGLHGVG